MHKLFLSRRAAFGLKKQILDSLYMGDSSSASEQIIQSSIHTGVPSAKGNIYNPVPTTYQTSKLASGITVMTESVGVPSNVNLGIFMNVGSRDENAETSGTMLSLKNTYLKTALNTNETVNYGIAQMSGGEFEMDFNRESTFYRAACLSHDVIDVFSMMADCAFEPKNFVAANVGIHKNEKNHQLDEYLGGNQSFNDNIYATAFGRNGLGMPLYGRRSNISNLTAYVIQNFQNTYISPDRVVISATGVENHQEFVDLVNEKMFFTQLNAKSSQRETSQYLGGQIRNITESSNVHIAFAFQGANHKNALPLFVAQQILGNNRRSGRIQRNILNKNVFIDGAQAFSTNYEDTGLFGLKVSGSASHAQDVANVAARELSELRNVSDNDVQVAKQTLIARIQLENTTTHRRLEDRTKSLFYLGATQENLAQLIENVSTSDVQSAVSEAFRSPLTFVAQGGEVNRLPSYENLSKIFQ